jgi:hypothetical protein
MAVADQRRHSAGEETSGNGGRLTRIVSRPTHAGAWSAGRPYQNGRRQVKWRADMVNFLESLIYAQLETILGYVTEFLEQLFSGNFG